MKYTEEHEWIRLDGDVAVVADRAQSLVRCGISCQFVRRAGPELTRTCVWGCGMHRGYGFTCPWRRAALGADG